MKAMKKIHKKMIYTMAAMLVAVFILSLFSGSGVRIARAAAKATSEYTSVMDDLTKDTEFNAADYPEVKDRNTLDVIQIAESTDGELFVYVYQPSADEKFNATTLRLSLATGDNARWDDYKLTILSSEGALSKYLVNGVSVSDEAIRYYDIVAIHRKWIDGTDAITSNATSNGNHINEVVFAVGRLYTAVTENDTVHYVCTYTETIRVTDKYVGQLRYPNGYTFFNHKCDAHYVAFNTDKPMDKLYEVDIQWATQEVIRQYLLTILISTTRRDAVLQPMQTIKADYIGSTSPIGIGGNKYSFKRIVSADEFISTEKDLNDTAKKSLEGKQWVLRFTETDYTKSPLLNGSQSEQSYEVSDVTILRLKFDMDGVTYNLGVVDNKQEGSHKPDNIPEANDWWLYALALIGGSVLVLILGKIISKRIGVRAMAILGSFLCLIIAGTLRITAEIYMERFGWLSKLIMPLDITCYVMIAIFALFVLVEIFSALGSRRKSRRRYDADDGGEWE